MGAPQTGVGNPAPHPTGVNTSPELVAYRVEVAHHLVNVAERVVAAIKDVVAVDVPVGFAHVPLAARLLPPFSMFGERAGRPDVPI